MRLISAAVALLSIAGSAIAGPDVTVELRAQQPTYALGKPVEMTAVLTNRTAAPVEVIEYPKPWGVVAISLSAADAKGRLLADARVPMQGNVTPKTLSVRPGSYLAVPVYLNHYCHLLLPGEIDVKASYVPPGSSAATAEDAPSSLPVRITLAETSEEGLAAEAGRMRETLFSLPANGSPHFTIFRLAWTHSPAALEPLATWLAQKTLPWDSWYVEAALRYLGDDAAAGAALLSAAEGIGVSRAMANVLRSFAISLSRAMPAIVSSLKRPEQELQRGALWLLRWYGESHKYTEAERKVLYPLVRKAVDARDPLVRPSALPVLKMVTPPPAAPATAPAR